ncbi:helix-turn-helix domain-containing protein [Bdellovibrio sp. 22V]|uniref:helix-turn-helix domain-containing protein n=1 Tax=Bdellovibrio sp. 22V TaxID=3044166 RepID=UPI002543914F|nr:helix-turn-helix domain-containing protein [Bdellovibrio sp. 22V]WII73910.1 helix-turn-helix domain-containing protein [Bdellovibrio sp. 22V]
MSRTVMIVVSDNQETIENTKKYWENHDVTVQAYSSAQWREGLDNAFFRQQLVAGVPALISGNSPVNSDVGGNVIQFPTATSSSTSVQKMEELEAHAIENAIVQYKGNLTEAAKALGIGRATLYRKVKQYHIDPSAARKKKVAA